MIIRNIMDRLFGLLVRVPGYRSRGPGSIPGATRFLRSCGSGTVSTQPLEYNLALSTPTNGGRSIGIVLSRTQATQFVCFIPLYIYIYIYMYNFIPPYTTDACVHLLQITCSFVTFQAEYFNLTLSSQVQGTLL
jgi:hypothetical protein